MDQNLKVADGFVHLLFDEIYGVKERDFSIEINYLGSGLQKLLMLTHSKAVEVLSEEEKILLLNMLEKGLKRSMEDVWLVNIGSYPDMTLDSIFKQFAPAQCIIWGCDDWLNQQSIQLGAHQQGFVHGIELLKANPLTAYVNDQQEKTLLWAALKKMFFV